jgi:hypothetical protein
MKSSTDAVTDRPCPYLSQIKPWNGQVIYVEHLAQHYALMAMNKGTIDHARHMTKLLKSDFPTLNILIKKRIKELQDANTSV